MSVREGNLEPPKRHPLLGKPRILRRRPSAGGIGRVFDICHGCRRCVSLCNAFPKLFDLIDEGDSGEVDAIPKAKYWEVVDQCYLCDVCFMTVPHVPPHAWNVDFPHLMLRAKAIKFKKARSTSATSCSPAPMPWASCWRFRGGADRQRGQPEQSRARGDGQGAQGSQGPPASRLRAATFSRRCPDRRPVPRARRRADARQGGGFSTCYINYNEPGIGHDLLRILAFWRNPDHLGRKGSLLRHAEARTRRPGVGESAEGDQHPATGAAGPRRLRHPDRHPLLHPDVQAGTAADVSRGMPRCKQWPQRCSIRSNTWCCVKDGLLKTDFKQPLGKVSYHIPAICACRTSARKPASCCKWSRHHDYHCGALRRSRRHLGRQERVLRSVDEDRRPVFRQMAAADPDYVSSDCAIAGRHICQGMGGNETKSSIRFPLSVSPTGYDLRAPIMPTITRNSLMSLEQYAGERPAFRARVLTTKRAHPAAGRSLDPDFRRRTDASLSGAGNAADRENLRGRGHQRRTGSLQPAGTGREQLQGDNADRVSRRRTAPAHAVPPERHRGPGLGPGGRFASPVQAIADEDLERENEEKTSAVHFLRSGIGPGHEKSAQARATLAVGVDHPHYSATVPAVSDTLRQSLVTDLT